MANATLNRHRVVEATRQDVLDALPGLWEFIRRRGGLDRNLSVNQFEAEGHRASRTSSCELTSDEPHDERWYDDPLEHRKHSRPYDRKGWHYLRVLP